MRVLIVLAHPEPASFNGAMKDVAVATLTGLGHGVEVSDLYAMGFDPVEGPDRYAARRDADRFTAQTEQRHAWETGTLSPDVAAEIDKLERADLVIFQYPMWWYGMPAILKGWLDRVLVYGGLYTSTMRYDAGLFHRPARHALGDHGRHRGELRPQRPQRRHRDAAVADQLHASLHGL